MVNKAGHLLAENIGDFSALRALGAFERFEKRDGVLCAKAEGIECSLPVPGEIVQRFLRKCRNLYIISRSAVIFRSRIRRWRNPLWRHKFQ